MTAEEKLKALNLSLPAALEPGGNYVPFKRVGNTLYISGRGPRVEGGKVLTGKVGADVSLEDAYARARMVGLGLLSVARQAAGSLDKIEVVKLTGFVNAAPDFKDHPRVINGCSDLLVEVLGDKGRHARSAVGMSSLPHNMTVEIEAVMLIV